MRSFLAAILLCAAAAGKLVGGKGHDLLPSGSGLAVVLVAEGDAFLVELEKAAVRDRDPVGVAREVSEHRLGSSERRLGINDPALLPDGREVPQECAPFGKLGHGAKEGELAGVVQRAQPGQEAA